MSSNRRKWILKKVSVSLGCSSCKKPKLTSFFNPKALYYYCSNASSSKKTTANCSLSENETDTATFFPPSTDSPHQYWDMDTDSQQDTVKCSTAKVRGFGHVGGEILAVEEDSDDPYLDFRQSMLQMILEKEIYSKDDLRQLLNCFLQLNSPYYLGLLSELSLRFGTGFSQSRPAAPPRSCILGSGHVSSSSIGWSSCTVKSNGFGWSSRPVQSNRMG